jgi:hypothetical protein
LKKPIILVIVVGFLLIFYLLGGFQLNNEPAIDEFSVKSNDESGELFIPKEAFPEGVDIDDISVTKVSNNLTENGTWIVYDLKPDGLEFIDEILFNVTLDSVNDTFPIVFISNGTGIELVNNTLIEVDLENNTQTLTIPLTHFTTIGISYNTGTINLKLYAPDTFVGNKVNTIASFTLIKNKLLLDRTSIGKGIIVWELLGLEPHVIYKGTWADVGAYRRLEPREQIAGKPSSTQVNVGQTNTVQDDFYTCAYEGNTILTYKTEVTVSAKVTTYNSESDFLDEKINSSRPYRNAKIIVHNIIKMTCLTPTLEIDTSFNYTSDITQKNVFVDIKGPPLSTGIVTISGLQIETMSQPVAIGPSGYTRVTFTALIHDLRGSIHTLVEISELTAEMDTNIGD